MKDREKESIIISELSRLTGNVTYSISIKPSSINYTTR